MVVVKIKYRGQWRKVIGTSTNRLGHLCYKVLCDDPRYFNKIEINNPHIEDKELKDCKRYPTKTIRYKDLTNDEKEQISKKFKSGVYTLKDICEMFMITRNTVQKIVGVL